MGARSRYATDFPCDPDLYWAVRSNPAVNTLATIARAAPGAGFRHVVTSVTVVIAADTTAPTAISVTANVNDGTTTYWSARLSLPATGGAMSAIALSGLTIPIPENLGVNLSFSGAGGLNTFESVAMTGYTIPTP